MATTYSLISSNMLYVIIQTKKNVVCSDVLTHILVRSDYAGIPPVAVSPRVGRVWQSSAVLCLGATGSRPGIAAVDAGLLTHGTPGQIFFTC